MRIIDHCFVPQEVDQLRDECAYPDCGKREIEHEWTVEAYQCNPELGRPDEEIVAFFLLMAVVFIFGGSK